MKFVGLNLRAVWPCNSTLQPSHWSGQRPLSICSIWVWKLGTVPFVEKGHGFLDHVWNFLFPLHPHFVLNLICFCPCLLLPVLLMLMKVVVIIIIIISCLFIAVFPSGARMLAADVFLHLKSLMCMKLHTCTHTHTHTHVHMHTWRSLVSSLPLLFKCL